MRPLGAWLRRIAGTFAGSRADEEFAAELESHVAMHAADNERAGMAPDEARRQALLTLGGVAATMERQRERRGLPLLDELGRDVRYALRALGRNRGYAFAAILTLALGISAATAVFTIVDGVLLRPLPFDRPGELFLVFQQNTLTKTSLGDATPANFLDWRARTRSFAAMAALRGGNVSLALGDGAERVRAADVTPNFFDLLGVPAVLGRTFTARDGADRARVVVISDALWQQRFGGRPDVVGRTLRIDSVPYTIIGVLGPGLDYPDEAQLWYPSHWAVPEDPLAPGRDPSAERGHGYLYAIGRLAPGTSPAQARADLHAVGAALEREYPDDNRHIGIDMRSLHEELVGDTRPALLLLLAAVGLLLLIATVNVSGLLIARGAARRHEIAIRLALGASRARVVRQLLVESVVVAALGGLAGTVAAIWATGPLLALSPLETGISRPVHADVRVLLFALGVSMLAGVLCGVIPARQTTAVGVHEDLKQSPRAGGGAPRRLRAVLVATEIALSVVLLIASGLTIRSLAALGRVHTGFDATNVLTVQVSLSDAAYATPEQQAEFWTRARGAIAAIPGVTTAGAISRLPVSGGNSTRGLTIDGRDPSPPVEADYRSVMPEYFAALRIPVLRGRLLGEADGPGRPPVALVSDSLARRDFPGLDPIGHQISIGEGPITIVGVVGDVRHVLEASPHPTVYVPYRQDPWPFMAFALRTSTPPATLGSAVHAAIRRLDPNQAIGPVATLSDRLHTSTSPRRFIVGLLAGFGTCAALLAAIGLYGVLAFLVAERKREIGVRMALGAARSEIVRAVVGDGLRLAAAGLLFGLVAAAGAMRLLKALLFDTSATDVPTFAAAAGLLVAVAVAASAVPALRASRVDPADALRSE